VTRQSQNQNRRNLALGLTLAAGFLGALWLGGSLLLEQSAKSATSKRPNVESRAESPMESRPPEPRHEEARAVPEPSEPPGVARPESIAAAVVSPERPREAHPTDEAHRRIQRANQLNQAANDAVDLGRAAELREVLDVYQRLDPQDESGLQLGYRTILQCLEEPGAASTSAAERFMVEHRASILRRFVRRHCIGDR
jgi:hypothetical protein